MFRRMMLGLLVVAGLAAAGWMVVQRRATGQIDRSDAVQWPFEQEELRTLMSRVVDEQRERVAGIEDGPSRARAQAFLEYYDGRRQAAVS